MWMPATLHQPPGTPPAAYVAVLPASSYSGGTPTGTWLDVPGWLTAALDVTWGQEQTPHAVFLVGSGVSQPAAGKDAYYAVVGVKYGGGIVKTSAYTSAAKWVDVYALTGAERPGQTAPSTATTTVSGSTSATDSGPTYDAEVFVGPGGKQINGINWNTKNVIAKTSAASIPSVQAPHHGLIGVWGAGRQTGVMDASACTAPNVLVLVPQKGPPSDPIGYASWECVIAPSSVSAALSSVSAAVYSVATS